MAGAQLLAELSAITEKHVITEDHCKVAIALWTILASLVEVVDIMPILATVSPEKRCGKSRLLTLLLKLVRRPIPSVSLSAATVYRAIEKWHPTLLIDEADGVLKDSKGHDNLELRSVINSGHTRELAYVNRCVGDNHDVQRFSTWAPKAIALIGKMPDSMMDRSIPIPMRRKTKGENVARIRETPEKVFEELRAKIVRFCDDHGGQIAQHVPTLPSGRYPPQSCVMPEPSQPPRPQFLNHAALRSSSLPAEEVFDSIVTEFCSSNPARTDHLKRVAFCWAHSWVHASIAPDAIVVGELGRVFHRAYMRDHYQRNRQKILERRHQRERRNHYDQ